MEGDDYNGQALVRLFEKAFLELLAKRFQFLFDKRVGRKIIVDQLPFRLVRLDRLFPIRDGQPKVLVDSVFMGEKDFVLPFGGPDRLRVGKFRVQGFKMRKVHQSFDVLEEQILYSGDGHVLHFSLEIPVEGASRDGVAGDFIALEPVVPFEHAVFLDKFGDRVLYFADFQSGKLREQKMGSFSVFDFESRLVGDQHGQKETTMLFGKVVPVLFLYRRIGMG